MPQALPVRACLAREELARVFEEEATVQLLFPSLSYFLFQEERKKAFPLGREGEKERHREGKKWCLYGTFQNTSNVLFQL